MTTATTERYVFLAEDRRRCLLRLAEEIVHEDARRRDQDFTNVLELIVPTLAAAAVPHPVGLFERLVEARRDQMCFANDEAEWLTARGLSVSMESRANAAERLEAEVDLIADQLMGRHL